MTSIRGLLGRVSFPAGLIRRALASLALASVAVATVGCAELPRDSAVKDGPDIGGSFNSDYLYYSPSGPVRDETKEDILAGFLNASTGPQNDFSVARQYLSPDFKAQWSPNTQVYIQNGVQRTRFQADNSAAVSIGVSATVDALGHYLALPDGSSRVLNFKLALVKGQWRIAEAPNAIVMIRPVFDVIFHSYPVYFFDNTFGYLVPDLRWFPARASTATRLTSAVLAGPSPWLLPSIKLAMPLNTKLAIEAVTLDKRTAVVNLDLGAIKSTKSQREHFKAQLLATLSNVSGVKAVRIQVNGAELPINDFKAKNTTSGAYAPVVLTSSGLQQLIGPSGGKLSNANSWITSYAVTDFAVSSTTNGLALMAPSGVYFARLDQPWGQPKLIDTRKSLLNPRFDKRGQLWLLGSDGALHITDSNRKSVWSALPLKSGQSIVAFALSPEGSRLAYLTQDADGATKLLLCAVQRDATGKVVGFGNSMTINHGVGTPKDIEFSGETGLDVLATVNGTTSNLVQLTLGGDPREISTLNSAVGLMTSDDGSNVYILNAKKEVQQYRGYTWSTLMTDVVAAHMVN